MRESVCPPRRMRFSFETRCRIVTLIVAGESPAQAAAAFGASRATGYRLWVRYREGGWWRRLAIVLRRRCRSRGGCRPRRSSRSSMLVSTWRPDRSSSRPPSVGPSRRSGRCFAGRAARGCRDRSVTDVCATSAPTRASCCTSTPKKLGRFFQVGKRILADGVQRSPGAGWQHLHVAIDDHSRLAYCELLASERKEDCCAFLERAVAWYAEHGIIVERILSDNAKAYHSHAWRETCAELGIGRRYTRPYSPWTNGKAEALIKTLLREWARRFAYPTSAHRAKALPGFVRWYNRRRPHSSIGGKPPISRVSHLCGQYS